MTRGFGFLTIGALLFVQVGCYPFSFNTDANQWRLTDESTASNFLGGFTNTVPVLEGTAICVQVEWLDDHTQGLTDRSIFTECFEHYVVGEGTLDIEGSPECITLDGPGPVMWGMSPTSCSADFGGMPPVADSVTFETIGADVVQAELPQWADEYALVGLVPGPGESFPPDLLNPEGEPYRVMSDQPVVFFAQLVDPESDQVVAWSSRDGQVVATAQAGTFEESTQVGKPGWIGLTLADDSEVGVSMHVNGHTFDAGTVVSVAPDAPVSMELGALYSGDGEFYNPVTARAILRDAEGNAIFGAPVTWTVTGNDSLTAHPGPEVQGGQQTEVLPGADYVELVFDPVDPVALYTEQTATLEASYGDLSATVELVWTSGAAPPEDGGDDDDDDDDAAPSEGFDDQRGCQCSSQGSLIDRSGPLALVLLGLCTLVRRRLRG